MAKTSKNVLGDQRGKIGKIVGRVVEGEQIYSAHPGPRGSGGSAKQIEHRIRFSAIVKMGRPLKGAIKLGLKVVAASKHLQSPFNIFVKNNTDHVTYDTETHIATPVYSDIVLADGVVPFVSFAEPSFGADHQVTVSFTGNGDCPGAFDNDKVYVAAYCPELNQSALATATRSTGTLTLTTPPNWAGKAIHLWGFTITSVTEKTELENYGIELLPGASSLSAYIGTGEVS